MCGITGWISFDRDLRSEQETVDAMTETMACRGPDDRGTWVQGPAALGHCRLAIIDLPGGRQPMTAERADGSPVTLVYSGEAYNFGELRKELVSRGHRFTTGSDTEVVLRGYLEWGEEVAGRLNGMFAFAVWDEQRRRLVMIRDRMGIKPFYYYPTPDGVLFGSEPKAILANPLAGRNVGLDGLRELFAFVKTPGHAIWDGMYEVEPGTVVTVDRNGLRPHVYWSLRDPCAPRRPGHLGRSCPYAARRHRPPSARRRCAALHPAVRRPGLLRHDRAGGPSAGRDGRNGTQLRGRLRRADRALRGRRAARHPRHPLRARRGPPRRHRPPGHRAGLGRPGRPRCPREGHPRPGHPDGLRRHGRLALSAVQGDPRALHGRPVR